VSTREAIAAHYKLADSTDSIIRLESHARASLSALYGKLGFKLGAEIGVWEGQHAEWICQMAPKLELLCIDGWERFAVKSGYHSPVRCVRARQKAEQRLAKYKATILPMLTDEAAALVPDRSLDFIFIDASHGFDDVMRDLLLWVPKVKPDGIISGHDYETTVMGWPAENGVKEAVHAYIGAHGISPLYLLMGTARDRWKSYFWVNDITA